MSAQPGLDGAQHLGHQRATAGPEHAMSRSAGAAYGTVFDQAETSPDSKPSTKITL